VKDEAHMVADLISLQWLKFHQGIIAPS